MDARNHQQPSLERNASGAGDGLHQREQHAAGLGGGSSEGPLRELNNMVSEVGDPYGLGSLTATLQIERSKADRWIYPKNVPMRRYQAEIVETAIFHNTLVCLPTGLGKTLIAAVVMYNYYSWFPEGKVIFVAPTKPLVDQQREACLFKVSIAEFDTAELTGKQKPEVRKELWEKKRVFFCTPHIVANDIAKGFCDESKFVCLVVDECHRGVGNYPSVKVVEHLKRSKVKCRIVGLSATPGRTKEVIQEIIRNLLVARVEFRNEEDGEIKLHTHERTVRAITVRSELQLKETQQTLHSVMRRVIKPLIDAKVFYNYDVERITRYSLVRASQGMRTSGRQNAGWLQRSFQQAIFLASLMENLENGIRVAHEFLKTSCEEKPLVKSLLSRDLELEHLRGMLEKMVKTNAEHPKMQKLVEILTAHLSQEDSVDRVVVFTSLRETVNDIVQALERNQCGATAKKFIGQGGSKKNGGMTQKEQKRILQDFRDGKFNTLVATCIGEEGLDIPEVSLIVCYDGAASPIRDTQRMGRTGRHAAGNVVYLLSEGRQKEKYDRNQAEASRLHMVLRQAEANFELNPMNPRMIPREFNPKMLLVNMNTVKPEDLRPQATGKGRKRPLQKNSSKATGKGKSSKAGSGAKQAHGTDSKRRRKEKSGSMFLQVPDSDDENLLLSPKPAAGPSRHAYQTDEEEEEEEKKEGEGKPNLVVPQYASVCQPREVDQMETEDTEGKPEIIEDFYAYLDSDVDNVGGEAGGPGYGFDGANHSRGPICFADENEINPRQGHLSVGTPIDLTDTPPMRFRGADCKRRSSNGHITKIRSNDNSLERQQGLQESTPLVIKTGVAEGGGVDSQSGGTSCIETGKGGENPDWMRTGQSNESPRSEAMRQVRDDRNDNANQSTFAAPEPPVKLGPMEGSTTHNEDSSFSRGADTIQDNSPVNLPFNPPGCSRKDLPMDCAKHLPRMENDDRLGGQSSELEPKPCTVAEPPSNRKDLQQTRSGELTGAQGSEKRSKRFWDRPSAVNSIKPQIESKVTVVCESSDSEEIDLVTPCHTKRASKAQEVVLATPPTVTKSDSPLLRSGERMVDPSKGLIQSKPGGSHDMVENSSARLSADGKMGGVGNISTQMAEEACLITPCRKRGALQVSADTTGGSSAPLWNHKRRATQAVDFGPSPSVLGDASQENRSEHEAGSDEGREYLDLEANDSEGNADNEDSVHGYSDEEFNGFIDNATQPAMMTQRTQGSTPNMMACYHESLLAAQPPTPEFLKRLEQEANNPEVLSQDEEGAELTEEIESEGGGDGDVCVSCGQGGLLLLCNACNTAHHPHCVGLNEVPSGDWFCPQCLEDAALLSE
ncbi:hypothetical protein BSKO_00645 [Bryopsis sp. KO-2023]|nr:hypothetical protein BSKO_00645 [Bryopsis sp. KO-2023]